MEDRSHGVKCRSLFWDEGKKSLIQIWWGKKSWVKSRGVKSRGVKSRIPIFTNSKIILNINNSDLG